MPEFSQLNVIQKLTYIFVYVDFIVGIIGIVGNLIVIFIFSRSNLAKYSFSFYTRAKAVADTLLIAFGMRLWVRFFYDIDPQLLNQFSCLFWGYGDYVLGVLGQFYLVLMSFDRVLLIIYPNRFQIFRKKWFQAVLVLVVTVYTLIVNIPFVSNTKLTDFLLAPGFILTVCFTPSNIVTIQAYISLSHVLLLGLIANSGINFKLFLFIRSSRNKVAASNNNESSRRTQKNDRKFAIISIGIGLITFVGKFASGVLNTVMIASANLNLDQYMLMITLALLIFFFDGVITFFLNIWLNSAFREEFLFVLGLRKSNAAVKSSGTGAIATINKKFVSIVN